MTDNYRGMSNVKSFKSIKYVTFFTDVRQEEAFRLKERLISTACFFNEVNLQKGKLGVVSEILSYR